MRLIDADVLLSQMDSRYREKEAIVPNTLAEGFMQTDKLINQQDIFNLSQHDSELLDKVIKKQRTIIDDDGVMYRVVFLKDIEKMKAEIEEVRVNEHSKEDK